MIIKKGLTFDDVLLVPQKSFIRSRNEVNLATHLSRRIKINIPIVSANMDTVTESKMAIALANIGGIGIIHRFCSPEFQADEVRKVKRSQNIIIEDPISVDARATLGDVKELMKRHNIKGVLVTSTRKSKKILVGIITGRDLLPSLNNKTNKTSNDKIAVSSIMTTNLVTARKGIKIEQAIKLLHKHRIEKLPLINTDGELNGLITLRDINAKTTQQNSAKDKKGHLLVGSAVGVKAESYKRADLLVEAGTDVLVIDIAHGHNILAIEMTKYLKNKYGKKVDIIAGNIASAESAKDLIRAGADGLKVGIGPGAACTTRVVTGVGIPQMTAIFDVASVAQRHEVPFIADGGVKNSGSFCKALAGGASSVMIGNLLAGCSESPGEFIMDRGVAYKLYRGMASFEATKDKRTIDNLDKIDKSNTADLSKTDTFFRSPEGAQGRVAFKGNAEMVLTDLCAGLRSSMSYLGARNLSEFYKNANFVQMTDAGKYESGPHGV